MVDRTGKNGIITRQDCQKTGGAMREEALKRIIEVLNNLEMVYGNQLKADAILFELEKLGIFLGDKHDTVLPQSKGKACH